ncbi:MAG: thiolase family protein [Myxococcota bacterium]|nr:thiolase family protein [Myxococcota bacterium]
MNGTRLAIAGIGTTPVTRSLERPLLDTCVQVTREALDDAQLEASEIDGLFVSPARMSGEPWLMYAANLAEHLGLCTKSLTLVENGGATALLTLRAAMDAVALGRCRTALVLASDTRPMLDTNHFESFVRFVAFSGVALYGPVYAVAGLGTPIPIYAMSAQRYMHEYGVDEAAIAQASVLLRQHASTHPLAQFRKPITVDEVLSSKMLSPPIRLLQAAGISAGACAVLVTRAENITRTDRPPVIFTGYGEHHHPSHFIPRQGSITRFESVEIAGQEALEQAGRTPAQVDVAEVYGVFGATELILYEDLGFCDKGTAAHFLAEGRSTFGGDVVINPSGGRISFGHPAGATPLYEVAEVAHQLRGDAPGRQVADASVGLVHAEHGMMNGSIVLVLEAQT